MAADPAGAAPRALVLCADDYAQSAAVSAAVRILAAQGRLTATSAMVLSPTWPDEAAALKPLHPRLDVGLHLDVTSELAQAAGHGQPLGAAMRRAALGGWNPDQARALIERQLDAFEAAWGAPPDHVDGHQHVQQFNGIRQALLAVLARRYPAQRPWLRVSRAAAGSGGVKARVIAALGADALQSGARAAAMPVAPWLTGIYGFDAAPGAYAAHMARWLRQAPDGALLMCHPATRADAGDAIGSARVCEFDYLRSEAFGALLQAERVRLVRGSALFGAA